MALKKDILNHTKCFSSDTQCFSSEYKMPEHRSKYKIYQVIVDQETSRN